MISRDNASAGQSSPRQMAASALAWDVSSIYSTDLENSPIWKRRKRKSDFFAAALGDQPQTNEMSAAAAEKSNRKVGFSLAQGSHH